MPRFVLGVNCAEPPTADLAVICSRGVAWFIHRRYRLTSGHNVSGFCLILLLQHRPSYTGEFYACFGNAAHKTQSPRASTNLPAPDLSGTNQFFARDTPFPVMGTALLSAGVFTRTRCPSGDTSYPIWPAVGPISYKGGPGASRK